MSAQVNADRGVERASRFLVTTLESPDEVVDGLGEFGFEGDLLPVDLDDC
ncbi:hypothetical protein KIH74_35305 [Kineosporia sp. J2-2]|uniref:Uncharacterized protein n=1 Tax=Kineosporia corallincola TaxID=2835133 RepID=A0ABS5TTZ5_9ACTN|nr:hypothetical protein [Kineosporia corallincola]MBT0774265.1 hypothetical protein [Kineosporia corallincola]